MNDTQQKHGGAGVEQTVRGFWSSRPQRPRSGRKAAGVAMAIANRYAIDPTLVRVAFVVTTLFGGAGLVAYLLGWLFLAQEGEEASAFESMIGRGHSSVSTPFAVVLCVALIPTTSAMLSGGWVFGGALSGPIGFAGLIVALYLLHRSRAHLGVAGPVPAPAAAEPAPWQRMFAPMFNQQGTATAQAPHQGAGGWDPLGAAPFAWDLPEPTPPPQGPPPRPPRRRSRSGLAGLATAVIAVAICVMVAPVTGGWMTIQHMIGIVLAVLGLALVGAAFRGGQSGLIPLAVLLGAAGLVSTSIGGIDLHGQTGDHRYTPAAISQVQPDYRNSFGNLTVDLTKLPPSGTVHTTVGSMFGSATVLVPRDADVTVNCHENFGQSDCLGRPSRGVDAREAQFTDTGNDGPGGLVIDLQANTKFGNIEVNRG